MGTVREEDVHGGVIKKSKKRKKEESVTSKGEDGVLHVHDENYKNLKSGFQSDANAAEAIDDLKYGLGFSKSSGTEKKMQNSSRVVAKDQGHDNKKKRKKEKIKLGDEGGATSVLGTSVENQTENGVTKKVEPMNDKKKKKKRNEGDDSRSGSLDKELLDERCVHSFITGESNGGKRSKRKKDKFVKSVAEGVNVCSSETKERNMPVRTDFVENQTGNKVIEKRESMEDKKRKKKKKDGLGANSSDREIVTNALSVSNGETTGGVSGKRKKKYLGSSDASVGASETNENNGAVDCADISEYQTDNKTTEKFESMGNKEKKKKKKHDLGTSSLEKEFVDKSPGLSATNGESSGGGGNKEKSVGSNSERADNAGTSEINNANTSEFAEPSNRSTSSKKSKRVTFSDQDEYFSLPDNSSKGQKEHEDDHKGNTKHDDGLIRGKWFSKEEDELVKKAVLDYIEEHQLGENGLEMVLKCKSHPELKDCWKEIGEALPYRPYMSVYYRAHVLFERSESRKWTPEELELVKKFHEKHGADWKTLANELGKHRIHLKDAWRRIKLPGKGNWSQDEYQTLFDLVNLDLSMKVFEEKKSKHGMLRDNISWEAISEKLGTRSNALCCMKWYNQLTSPLVAEGKWANTDDYRLLIALNDLDAACEEDVDWDDLLEQRSGDLCRKRWNQMVRHIGQHGIKSFGEQVEILSQRYCPEMLETRETYDSRPTVD